MRKKLTAVSITLGFLLASLLAGCSGGGGDNKQGSQSAPVADPAPAAPAPASDPPAPAPTPTPAPAPTVPVQLGYSTSVSPAASQLIVAAAGGEVALADNSVSLSVPAGALKSDTTVTIGLFNNPRPALPVGLNFVGTPTCFGPDGTTFSVPATLKISFTEAQLSQAGVTSKADLKLYTSDTGAKDWSEAKITSIDTNNDIVIGQVSHFSFYALVGLSGMPPEDLGHPQPGDMLFTMSSYLNNHIYGWVPGHMGLFTDEIPLSEEQKKFASPDAFRCGMFNTAEALIGGVTLSYYKIPNTIQSCQVETTFSGNAIYMGARQLKGVVLTADQRKKIVAFALKQAGKPYALSVLVGDAYGLLPGENVEGPDTFNCIGYGQKSYMEAGVNGGDGILSSWKIN